MEAKAEHVIRAVGIIQGFCIQGILETWPLLFRFWVLLTMCT